MKTYLKNAMSLVLYLVFFSFLNCTNDSLFADAIFSESKTPEEPKKLEEPKTVEESKTLEEPITYEIPEGSYYVTINGNSDNDGLSETTAWNIEYAFSNAKEGDYVFIKAGNYGNLNLKIVNEGTEEKPIRFIGYENTPGDIQAKEGSTFKYGDALDAKKMPLLKAERINSIGTGTAIKSHRKFIEIANFQITHYKNGIVLVGEHNTLNNIIVTEIGDFNPEHSYPTGTSNAFLNYNGTGILLDGDYSIIKNCLVLNSGAENFRFKDAKYQEHYYNTALCDNDINPTDYYYLFSYDASYNTVRNITVERIGDLQHEGHGLTLKFNTTNNKIYDSTIINTSFEFSYSGVKHNESFNCSVIGGEGTKYGKLLIANGANNNTFTECTVTDCDGVTFSDWDEDFTQGDVKNAGHNNTFMKCNFHHLWGAINFHWFSQNESPAQDNIFEECIFSDMENLFIVDRINENTKLINCTIKNVEKLRSSFYPKENNDIPLIFSEENSLMTNSFDF